MAKTAPPWAAIDIGANTCRLLIARCDAGRIHPLHHEMHTLRLGETLHDHKIIPPETLARAKSVFTGFRAAIARFAPEKT